MKNSLFTSLSRTLLLWTLPLSLLATDPHVIHLTPSGGNDCALIRDAIEQVRAQEGAPTVIKFGAGTYHLRRTEATPHHYHISNTLSWSGNPDHTKYIGIHLKGLNQLTLEGEGALFMTHGEVTALVADSCEQITFRGFTIDAADPTLTEMRVERLVDDRTFEFRAHETSNFEVAGNRLLWRGEGWSFAGDPAQLYDPIRDITWRSWSPQSDIQTIESIGEKLLRIRYHSPKEVKEGQTFQMRDGVRDQVAGFVHKSRDVRFEKVDYRFMGNFGIVCQYSDQLTFQGCNFAPDPQGGRTSSGFADFLQVSGCKGLLKVEDCRFQGAHDDPINVHGTYLKATEYISENELNLQFQHYESWGFEAFFVGDSIEFVEAATLQAVGVAQVTAVKRVDDRNIRITFAGNLPRSTYERGAIMVENITWTPEVEIRGCHFSRIPTRGILLTTRRRSVIENNLFERMQMAAIYVSGDAKGWYESGRVMDLTIRNNRFVECGSPVIYFEPTHTHYVGSIHENILIEQNHFYMNSGIALGGRGVATLRFKKNTIHTAEGATIDQLVQMSEVVDLEVSDNEIKLYKIDTK